MGMISKVNLGGTDYGIALGQVATTTSTSSPYIVTVPDVTEYYNGLQFVLVFKNSLVNTNVSSTISINVNGLGTKALRLCNDSALDGSIKPGDTVGVIYYEGAFYIIDPGYCLGNYSLEMTSHNSTDINGQASNTVKDYTIAITNTGKWPLGIVGWHCSTRYGHHCSMYLSNMALGSATINFTIFAKDHALGSSSSPASETIYVLWDRFDM